MVDVSSAPDIGTLQVPMDSWTEPFWAATAQHRLVVPQCAACGHVRWPPGPFCPACQSQAVDWIDPGTAHLYSFVVMHDADTAQVTVPALVEFPAAGNVRLLAAIVGAPVDQLAIGASLQVEWSAAANAVMPIFRVAQDSAD